MQRTNSQDELEAREARLKALLLRGLTGDQLAYQDFLGTLALHVRAFLRSRLSRRPAEIEDMVQDVLLAVHNARHTYQAQQPLTAWVHAIARYKLADHLRSVSRREARHDVLDDDAQLFAISEVESAEASRDLTKLLKQLPERQRLPIVHVKLEGLSVEETAQLTGLSSSAVKVGIHRGLKALSRLIGGANNHED
ncbi:sigma-70 family RNA polymerase sigma factor [Pseudomonas putida]|jgi:RNA polymerase sigma-70 factor (ECF subfamily)|uniref:RNA polymerase subunit sigma n=1 Tax=Pseudomonas putida TaxID=303 RepID=A0A2S3WR26_PSEPU|nr:MULTISPECIES: sigma-70 family RNA polymerase sigma factor [Pseudomonas]EKT4457033.1 sigma-70 family RNA polymerase sigma factor [Pseudomonas putida]EKT4469375.1 sigma-70 family RNA polymerase sigma factor [Pseudomonas putida]EKT4495917.1 sigma-70 family RNA polymerase sigma factor [Pseudomonas putida]EKT4512537.1 sigma-70 family RNA polymerase sigma factor [Pseudomonas putida]EKT8868144.1 sigma-70 family RNA polymerase sigma factor [Pseudomonas putida]